MIWQPGLNKPPNCLQQQFHQLSEIIGFPPAGLPQGDRTSIDWINNCLS